MLLFPFEERNAMEKYQKVKELTEKLEAGITTLFQSDTYQKWLTTMSRFHNYSINNQVLIYLQNPQATLVAGYQSWKSQFGRQVRQGEKAIQIIAPIPRQIEIEKEKINPKTGEIERDIDGKPVKEKSQINRMTFRVTYVFDVAQTDGRELPKLGVDELMGAVDRYPVLLKAVSSCCPVPISYETINNGAKGYYHRTENRIVVQEGMSEVQTLKTLIHEMAHQKLHSVKEEDSQEPKEKKTKSSKEVEAESVAYTVCQYLGIDTSDYSFAYIAGWSSGQELAELKESMAVIRQAASELITGIENQLEQLCHPEKAKEQESLEAHSEASKSILSVLGRESLSPIKNTANRHRNAVGKGEER